MTSVTTSDELFCELPSGFRICYRLSGDEGGEPLLLIAGLGLHMTSWPRALVDGLVAQGFRVITFDNRDVGRSSRATARPPGLARQLFRRITPDSYDLGDMANDTMGLLDFLRIKQVHLVGMSMGGMIAQTIASRHPERVRSLTSIFSTTGDSRIGQPALSTLWRFTKPRPRTRDEAVESYLGMARHIGPAGLDEQGARTYAAEAWDRGDGATAHRGIARQVGAIMKSGDRTEQVRQITAPTLVIHGDVDHMVNPNGGRATADAIPGAKHVTIHGMGHYLSEAISPRLVDLIVDNTRRPAPAHDGPPRRSRDAAH